MICKNTYTDYVHVVVMVGIASYQNTDYVHVLMLLWKYVYLSRLNWQSVNPYVMETVVKHKGQHKTLPRRVITNNYVSNDMSCGVSTLSLLPYYTITNIELYNTLENVETYIKSCLANQNFPNYIHSTMPEGTREIPCNYYTTEEFGTIIRKGHSGDLKMLHHNIRSLDLHFGEVISLLHTLDNNIDVIALSEIGKKNIANRVALLNRYGFGMRYDLPQLSKGGVALIFKNDLLITERPDLKIMKNNDITCKLDVEDIWIEISIVENKKKEDYVIGVVYRHPGSTMQCLDQFTKKIEQIMIKTNAENKKCVIMGDINIDGLKINSNAHVELFFKSVMEQNFIPTITLPTRVVDSSVSLIDHIIVNRNVIKNNTVTGNLYCGITDHMPNVIVIKSQATVKTPDRPFVRVYGETNMNRFRNLLENVSWEEYYKADDPNTALDLFYNIYNTAFNSSFPLKRLSRNRAKDKKWITTSLKQCIKNRDNLYKKYLCHPTPDNRNRHILYRNILTACLREAEDMFYRDLVKSENKNLYKLWSIFGSVINPSKKKKHNNIDHLIYGQRKITDDQEIADTINTHFSTIGQTLSAKINSNKSFKDYLSCSNINSLFLKPAHEEELVKEICQLNSKKAGGHDNISPKILKENTDIFVTPLLHLINLSFQTSIVPDKLKIARVIPIHKKEDRFCVDNYRPISLLSTVNKLLEKLMHKRLVSFLNQHKILYKYQFGFRQNYSTTLALIEITDNILQDLENWKFVCGIYLDLSKAFDTVDHTILLSKLRSR